VRPALLLAILALAAFASAGCGNPEKGWISLKSSGFDRLKQPLGPRRGMAKPAWRSSKNIRAGTARTGRF
jgi:hypothetical protein